MSAVVEVISQGVATSWPTATNKVTQPLAQCLDCGDWMRPKDSLSNDFPGMVRRSSVTQCFRCHGLEVDAPPLVGPPNPVTVSGLLRLLAERRRRGVDPDGILFDGEKPNRSLDQLISY